PDPVRAGPVAVRADAGYFAGDLARAAREQDVRFAIGAPRLAPLWRLLGGLGQDAWTDAIDMPGAQVTVSDYKPADWPEGTRLLIRRVRLAPEQISGDPRSRRRRTLPPEQRVLPLAELAELDAIYGYSFILTDLDVSSADRAVAVEHWYRHRTSVENVFRDGKHGAAMRHLPSGYPEVNTAWMWGALLAASMAGWLHQLTATSDDHGQLHGYGIRGGKAMITTLRHLIIRVPGRLTTHAGLLVLRPPPGHDLLAEALARLRDLPTTA
ncbi:MAG: transposase, partial [Jatrophihabitantaceae bacterium]